MPDTASDRFPRCPVLGRPRTPLPKRWRVAVFAGLAAAAAACTFEGYVPKEQVPKAQPQDRVVRELRIGEVRDDEIACRTSDCRVRYRVTVPRPGTLHVAVDGPRADGPGEPRIVQLALESPGQAVLAVAYGEDDAPFEVEHRVGEGPHYVLVQGFGGRVDYRVRVELEPDRTIAVGASDAEATGAAEAPPALPPGSEAAAAGAAADTFHRPGDVSDGADFAYDPSAQLGRYRSFAFAQDPAAELQGEPGSVKGNPFIEREVQREVRYFLADMGIDQVPAEQAQMLVSVHVGARSNTWYSINNTVYNETYDVYFDRWRSMGIHVTAHTYVDGTLMIDFIDPTTGHLVWHGWTTEPVPATEDAGRVIKNAVRAVLSQYAAR